MIKDIKEEINRIQVLELQQCTKTPQVSKQKVHTSDKDFENLLQEFT